MNLKRAAIVTLSLLPFLAAPGRAQNAPAAVLSGQPNNLAWHGATPKAPAPLPHSKPPASTLLVVNLRGQSVEMQRAVVSLQGLVNRERPVIYTINDASDRRWLDWMRQRGWIKSYRDASPRDLFRRYRSFAHGAVIPDPNLSASVNVAFMLSGARNWIVADEEVRVILGLPVKADLRGKWKTNAAAYQWAFDKLWPEMTHNVISVSSANNLAPRDYLVQNKVFTFWVTGPVDGTQPGANPTAEARLMEKLLAKMPANIPCLGYPYAGEGVGIQEGPGVTLLSLFAKYLIATDINPNLSVHSGIPVKTFGQKLPPKPKLNRNKVYLTFEVSDGDNLQVYSNTSFWQMWHNPIRGSFPVAWTLSPSAPDLIPDVVDWFYSHATPNDAFIGAVSGIGYMYPDSYAQRFREPDRKRVFDGFLDQTAAGMKRLGEKDLWIMGATRPNVIAEYAKRIPNLDALFPDYGRRISNYGDATYPTANNVPVFHAATTWGGRLGPEKVANAVREIRSITAGVRPAFIHVFMQNWETNLPTMQAVLRELGPDYVAVRPEHLAALYREELSREKLLLNAPSDVWALGGRTMEIPVGVQNVTAKPTEVRVQVAGGIRPGLDRRARLAVGTPVSFTVRGRLTGAPVTVSVRGPLGEKRQSVAVHAIPGAEIRGNMPAGTLRFVREFEAETMNHRAGVEQADPAANGGHTWAATDPSTVNEPGGIHIVFGPYVSVPRGRYVAMFRLKRTGQGSGPLIELDASLDNGRVPLGDQRLNAEDLPEGRFISIPMVFNNTGGSLETRVRWTGAAPVAVDSVTLYQIVK